MSALVIVLSLTRSGEPCESDHDCGNSPAVWSLEYLDSDDPWRGEVCPLGAVEFVRDSASDSAGDSA